MVTIVDNVMYLDDKRLGYFFETEKGLVFIMPRTSKKHKLIFFDSWGIAEDGLEEIIKRKVVEIRINVDKGKRVLKVSPEKFKRKGKRFKMSGFEEQIQLNVVDFDVVV